MVERIEMVVTFPVGCMRDNCMMVEIQWYSEVLDVGTIVRGGAGVRCAFLKGKSTI